MSVKLRLARRGATKDPHFRVVAIPKSKATNGRFLEILGTYNPTPEPAHIKVHSERVEYWLDNGAQPSDTVRSIVRRMRRGDVIDLDSDEPQEPLHSDGADEEVEAKETQEEPSEDNEESTDEADVEAAEEDKPEEESEEQAEEQDEKIEAADAESEESEEADEEVEAAEADDEDESAEEPAQEDESTEEEDDEKAE